MIISPEDTTGALWLGGACLLLSLLIATALRFTAAPHKTQDQSLGK
jgi:hypothetical protein